MKKFLFYSLLMAGGLCLATACGNDDTPPPTEDNDQNNGSNSSIISMVDAQNEIDRVGKEFLNKIDASKFKQIVELAQYCDETFSNDKVDHVVPPYSPDYPYYGIRTLMHQFSATAQGDFTRVASKRAIENFAFSQYSGVFTWDESNEGWVESEGQDNELCYHFKHNGQSCTAIVRRTGTEYDWNLKNENGLVTAHIKVPATLTATVTEGGKELASITVNVTECSQSGKNYVLNAAMNVSGYVISGNATNNNTEVNANFALTSGNETLIDGTAHVDGTYLADDNAIIKDEFTDNNVRKGIASATILNSIKLTVEADNTSGLYEKMNFEGYYYYNEANYEYMTTPYKYQYSSKEQVEKEAREAASAANRFIASKMLFHNDTYAANMEWEPYICYEYAYEWGTRPNNYSFHESVEWDIRPVLVFDNEARYSFENYFTEVRFRSLINVFEALMDSFEQLAE